MVHQIRTNSIFFNDVDIAVTFVYISHPPPPPSATGVLQVAVCNTQIFDSDKTQHCTAHSCLESV